MGMQLPSSFVAHALNCYPEEACGLICSGEFVPCKNISSTPLDSFEIDPTELLTRTDVEYIVHSHPRRQGPGIDPRTASKEDMQGQVDTDLPYAIAYCDGVTVTDALILGEKPRPPLEGREYVMNIAECLTLAVDYLAEKHGIALPACPRHVDWIERGEDLIGSLWPSWGFHEVALADARPSDVILFKLGRTKVVNHVGIYLGGDSVLHHLMGRLSCIDSLAAFAPAIDKVIRHQDLK